MPIYRDQYKEGRTVMIGMQRRLIMILVVALGLVQCKSGGSDKSSKDDETDSETLQVNPLAESYPQGLSMSALSNENVGDSGTTSGALAIDDSSALIADYEAAFAVATGETLLGYDRSACSAYHTGLADDKKMACACSHRQARVNSPDGDTAKEGEDELEKNVLGALFARGKDLLAEADERLRGSDDIACFPERLKQVVKTVLEASKGEGLYTVNCYEFDWGVEFPYRVSRTEQTLDSKEVCLVAFTRKEVAEAQAYLEFSTQLTQAMLCQAKKNGLATELSVGEEIDLTETVGKLDQTTVEPTAAKITRLEDQDGAKTYQTEFTMNVTPPEGGELAFDFKILHRPKGDTNEEYTGILSFNHDLPPRSGNSSKFKALSIAYSSSIARAEDPRRVKMELRMGEFKEGRDPFVDGEINFNVGASNDGTFSLAPQEMNANLSNMKYVIYDGYPTEGVMNFAYWRNPGEKYDENARGFIFNVGRDADNVIKGCAYAGASAPTDVSSPEGLSIRKSLKEGKDLEPTGFLRPFLCPYDPPAPDPSTYNWADQANRDRRFGPRIWKQCFVQNSDGSYSIDKSKTNDQIFSFAAASELSDFVAPPPPPGPLPLQ